MSTVVAPPPAPTGADRRPQSRAAVVRAYVNLTKPRIIELLLVTAVPAMVIAADGLPSLPVAVAVLGGGTLAAGAANALNCYLDRDIDPLMRRTARRPLATHAVSPRAALVFGLVLAVSSVAVLWPLAGWLPAVLALGAIAYYDLIYTLWLKRRTPYNTVLGGVSGSAPVLIGWAAVTGSLDLTAWLLFALVFLWQPPHFYALGLQCRDDYARAGVPMLPVVASTRRVTVESAVYCWLTVAVSLLLCLTGLGWWYAAAAVPLGVFFLVEAHRLDLRAARGEKLKPMRLFHASTSYLTLLSVAMVVDVFLG